VLSLKNEREKLTWNIFCLVLNPPCASLTATGQFLALYWPAKVTFSSYLCKNLAFRLLWCYPQTRLLLQQ